MLLFEQQLHQKPAFCVGVDGAQQYERRHYIVVRAHSCDDAAVAIIERGCVLVRRLVLGDLGIGIGLGDLGIGIGLVYLGIGIVGDAMGVGDLGLGRGDLGIGIGLGDVVLGVGDVEDGVNVCASWRRVRWLARSSR